MNFQRVIIISMIMTMLVVTLLSLTSGKAQARGEQVITFPGVVENISKDFEFIIVNETIISLSPQTRTLDEKGNILTLNDLKRGAPITIEVLKNQDRFLARKIVVKSKWK